MGAKLRVMLGLLLLAVGVASCAFVEPSYTYLDRQSIYGPGGGVGRD